MEDARRAVLGFQMSKLHKLVTSKGKRKVAGSQQMEAADEQGNTVKSVVTPSNEMPRKPCSNRPLSCSSRLWTSETLLSTDERPASCFTTGVSLLYDKQQSTLGLPQGKKKLRNTEDEHDWVWDLALGVSSPQEKTTCDIWQHILCYHNLRDMKLMYIWKLLKCF